MVSLAFVWRIVSTSLRPGRSFFPSKVNRLKSRSGDRHHLIRAVFIFTTTLARRNNKHFLKILTYLLLEAGCLSAFCLIEKLAMSPKVEVNCNRSQKER